MRTPLISLGALILTAASPAVAQRGAVPANAVPAGKCLIKLIEEVDVAAEEAGILQKILVAEGDLVKQDQQLAQIDDTMAKLQLDVASNKLAVAKRQALNKTTYYYACAAYEVALQELKHNQEINIRQPRTVPETEIKRLELTVKRAIAEIRQAEEDLKIAALQVNVSQAELNAAQEAIERRKLDSPIEAVVTELHHHPGDWVQQGEPVMRIIRLNRLWVEGWLERMQYAPHQINGCTVTVDVKLAGDRQVSLQGKIVFTSPEVMRGGRYVVRAEVENRLENGHWVLQPGLEAEMAIHLRGGLAKNP